MNPFVFKNRTNLGFVLAILMLLGIIAYAGISLQALIENDKLVSHALIVKQTLSETLSLVVDAETAVRGYIITGDERFLELYNAALSTNDGANQHLENLRLLTSDNPNQQKRLDVLESLIKEKLANLDANIELRRTSGFEAAQLAVASGKGNRTMEEIRKVIAEMLNEEDSLLEQRTGAASASLQNILLALVIGGPFALLLGSSSSYFLNRQIRERRRAQDALQQLNRELDQRVEERTAELAASESKYRDLSDNALIGIYRSTTKGEILYVNDTLAHMLGHDSPEAMIRGGALLHYRDPQIRQTFIEKLQREGKVESYELALLTKSGQPLTTLISAKIEGEQLTGTLLDITERKRAEEKLIASELRYRRLFEAARDGILILDAETGMIVDVNPFLIKMLGFSKEEFLGNKLWELGFFKDIAESKANFLELQQKGYIRYEDLPLETTNGRRFHVEFVSNVYQVDGNKVIQCNIRDITERKRAEEALRESEARYRHTLDNLMEGCQLIGFDWRYDYVNDLAAEHGRQTKDGLLGHTMMEVYPGIENTAMFAALRRCMEERISHRIENEFAYPDGTQGWFELNIQPVPDGIFILSADITDRKRAEEERLAREAAERANQAKSEFLSHMSHELRTPIHSILGFAQLLKMDELSPEQLGSLERILKSGRHLLDLINEVLDIARIESGRIPISSEPVHLDEAVQSAVELIQPLADQRGISIQIKNPSSRDVFMTADRQRLKQVLLNLLSNAVKYNREGGQIHVTASLLVDGYLHLAVRDTGAGIPPEKMKRLFVPFERLELDPSIVEGTGLGLALSKGLVEAMGGRIGAQSVVGEGSTFWFDLQLTTQQKEAIVMAEVDDYLKSAPGAKKGLVLYVEDNLSNIQLIEKILARLLDVKLVSAMQGRLAMDLARTQKPDLILLDLHLPDMHGSDVLQQLRAEVETKDIPIVVMSADATHGQIERMLAAGANAYLTKPIDVKEFLKVVGEMLGS